MTSRRDAKTNKTHEQESGDSAAVTLGQVRETVGGALATVRDRSEDLIADTREKAYRAASETNRLFQEHPIATVAAAAAAGAIVAIFLPKLAIASKAGAAAGKAGQMARSAMQRSGARQAAQTMFVGLAKSEKAALQNVALEAAHLVRTRLERRRARRKANAD